MYINLFKKDEEVICLLENNEKCIKLINFISSISLLSPFEIKEILGTSKPVIIINFNPLEYEEEKIYGLKYYLSYIYDCEIELIKKLGEKYDA